MSIIAASALLAFSVALPFGPVSLMCVQRSVMSGALRGLACGAGASTAHGLFAVLAVVGANAVAGWLAGWQDILQLAAGAMLVLAGTRMLVRAARTAAPHASGSAGLGDYISGLSLALTNPGTVLPYLGLAGSGLLVGHEGLLGAGGAVAGVMLGSAGWYATLSGSAWALKSRLPQVALDRANLIAGAAVIAMGLHLAFKVW